MAVLERWRRQRILQRWPLRDDLWQQTIGGVPILSGLQSDELDELRALAGLFLHDKSLQPVQGLVLVEQARIRLAAQACLPILRLGNRWYRGWTEVILYPYEFFGGHSYVDEAGVVHEQNELQSGESWQNGPVILSMPDVRAAGQCNGDNVIIHELAHKLDMLNGDANGYPPLHRGMSSETWSRVFQSAYDDLTDRVDCRIGSSIDAYASESPAECFAVFSEYFFTQPGILHNEYPQVYEQLRQFYRQHPLARLYSAAADSGVD